MTVPVIIDIIAAALLIGFTLYGARRGLFRALAGLLIVVLALTGARFAAAALAPAAAEMAAPVIQRHIEERLEEVLPDSAGGMPEEVLPEELLGLLGITGGRLEDLAEQAREGVRETGVSILSAVARSVTESFFYGVICVLVFLLLTVLLNLAAREIGRARV